MIKRTLEKKLLDAVKSYPVVTLTGPRQSGKTTLVKAVFSRYEYVSLELPDQRSFALEDPHGFLGQFRGPVILDEIQRAPELFSYIQVAVFESLVVSELHKNFVHRGEQPSLYFWRDSGGREVDIIIDLGIKQIPIEAKSGQTAASDFFDMLVYWRGLSGDPKTPAALVYGGDKSFQRSGIAVYPWYFL